MTLVARNQWNTPTVDQNCASDDDSRLTEARRVFDRREAPLEPLRCIRAAGTDDRDVFRVVEKVDRPIDRVSYVRRVDLRDLHGHARKFFFGHHGIGCFAVVKKHHQIGADGLCPQRGQSMSQARMPWK